ncbi:hypothetical protein KZP23_19610 [Echinicola marina]|uniref:hypothetical protein n=1 Tax=Echinicola marina TaxID=2859768 RepID=UPI001CF6FD6D|nr:hypothetical protein [Echinicola marina]UCS92853.1 hypothetical protein KZP23_19610 [Echinicola marina]
MRTDLLFDLKTKKVERTTLYPKGVYKPGVYYSVDRYSPGRAYSKENHTIYYSFPNADSIYAKDVNSGKVKAFYAKDENLQPFIEMQSYEEISDMMKNSQATYISQQGAYYSIFAVDEKDMVVRSAYLGIPNYDPQIHNERGYAINKALMFFRQSDHQHLGTIYLKNIDERFVFFDEDHFYVYSFDHQDNEDQMVLDQYDYPEF